MSSWCAITQRCVVRASAAAGVRPAEVSGRNTSESGRENFISVPEILRVNAAAHKLRDGGCYARFILAIGHAKPRARRRQHTHARQSARNLFRDGGRQIKLLLRVATARCEELAQLRIERGEQRWCEAPAVHRDQFVA